MIYLGIFTAIYWHFIYDWMVQDRDIAKTKKEYNSSLYIHMLGNILPLSLIIGIIIAFVNDNILGGVFATTVNWVTHFMIDAWLPPGKNEREMIDYTAIDQVLHIGVIIFLFFITT